MHFTVLSALPLPQDTSTAMNAVTVDDVVSFVAGKLLLENLASQKPVKMPEVDSAMIDSSRWECLVECMVDSLLAPYNENNTDIAACQKTYPKSWRSGIIKTRGAKRWKRSGMGAGT